MRIPNTNIFTSRDSAERYFEQYRPGSYTSKLNGGQMTDYHKLVEFVDYKIANGEIKILKEPST